MKGEGMDKVREALAELVACDDAEQEHIALDYFVFRNMASAEQVARWRETDTKDRKPLAMAAAREALSAQPAEPVAWRHKERINGEFDSDWILTKSEPPTGVRTVAIEPLFPPSAAPQPAPSEPAVGETWHILRAGATACATVEIEEITPSTVLFKSTTWGVPGERVPRHYGLRFIERAAPHPAAKGAES